MEIKTNNRLDYKDGVGLRFGVVVTLKEMYGVNRIEEFIRNCHLNGWLVNKIDVQIGLIFMKRLMRRLSLRGETLIKQICIVQKDN